jgi:hypothetical protein
VNDKNIAASAKRRTVAQQGVNIFCLLGFLIGYMLFLASSRSSGARFPASGPLLVALF